MPIVTSAYDSPYAMARSYTRFHKIVLTKVVIGEHGMFMYSSYIASDRLVL